MATLYTVLSWFMLTFGGSAVCDDSASQADFNPVPTSCDADMDDRRDLGDLDNKDDTPPPFEIFTRISNGF